MIKPEDENSELELLFEGWESDPPFFEHRYKYALARMNGEMGYDRYPHRAPIVSTLSQEDIATAYAMACELDPKWVGSFWDWASEAGLR